MEHWQQDFEFLKEYHQLAGTCIFTAKCIGDPQICVSRRMELVSGATLLAKYLLSIPYFESDKYHLILEQAKKCNELLLLFQAHYRMSSKDHSGDVKALECDISDLEPEEIVKSEITNIHFSGKDGFDFDIIVNRKSSEIDFTLHISPSWKRNFDNQIEAIDYFSRIILQEKSRRLTRVEKPSFCRYYYSIEATGIFSFGEITVHYHQGDSFYNPDPQTNLKIKLSEKELKTLLERIIMYSVKT